MFRRIIHSIIIGRIIRCVVRVGGWEVNLIDKTRYTTRQFVYKPVYRVSFRGSFTSERTLTFEGSWRKWWMEETEQAGDKQKPYKPV
jgi:hypothetical protein